MYKKAWCTCKVVVLRNKPIAFLTSWLPSPSSLLKLPIDLGEEEAVETTLKGDEYQWWPTPPCKQSLLLVSWMSGKKRVSAYIASSLLVTAAWTAGPVNLVFSPQTDFSSASIRLAIDRWSSLSRLYQARTAICSRPGIKTASNMQRKLSSDFTRFMQRLFEYVKIEQAKEGLSYEGGDDQVALHV